jgi:ribosomal protein L12E/L44/L45/RPP1/RPP2
MNEGLFSQSVVNGAILHFPAEDNISPQSVSESIDLQDQDDDPFGTSAYESRMKEELIPRTGEINGEAIFIIANEGNRNRSLEKLTSTIITAYQTANVPETIKTLRDQALKDAMAKMVADRAALESEQKKSGKKGKEGRNKSKITESKNPEFSDEDLGIDGAGDSENNGLNGEKSIWDDD